MLGDVRHHRILWRENIFTVSVTASEASKTSFLLGFDLYNFYTQYHQNAEALVSDSACVRTETGL